MKTCIVLYIASISLITTTLFSCSEIIDMEFTTDFERLVVDAQILDTDTLQYVKLSKINLNVTEGIVSPISDAHVVINDGTSDIDFVELDTLKGFYVAPDDFIGKAGKTYTLKISNVRVTGRDGSDVYSATAIMGNPLLLDSIAAEFINVPNFGILGYMLSCWAYEPVERNFYLFKAHRNGVLLTDTLYEYGQSDDLIFNGTYLNGVNCYLLQDEKPDEYVESGDTLALEIDNIDQAYFDYLNSAQSEYWGSNPLFGGPPANVVSNVSNGAVGIFRVFSVSKMSLIVEEAIRE